MLLYEKISKDLEENIKTRKIKQGERLPSIVYMSKKYNCSKGTVIRAYDVLRSQHIIFSKSRSGYYVADNLIRNDTDENSGYHLDTGNTIINTFSIKDTKHCLNIATELYAKNSLDLSLRGSSSLHKILPHQLAIDGVFAKKENIHIIQGVLQMLTLFTRHPFPNGKQTILIEEPSYHYYVDYLKSMNVKVLTIKRDEMGIDFTLLERYFKYEDIKFFYTIPRNHNPLGTLYSYDQRKKIMELALRYNVYIVEDDYFGGVYRLPKYVPIHYFSYQKNCIYLRSSTKGLPLIRIGVVVIPNCFVETFEQISKVSYFHSYHIPSLISQATWEAYIRSSLYEKHTQKITQSINKKLQLIKEHTVNWNNTYASIVGAKSGFYFTIQLHESVSVDTLILRLAKRNVYINSNKSAFYCPHHYDNSIRGSISKVSLNQLEQALTILYQEIISMVKGNERATSVV